MAGKLAGESVESELVKEKMNGEQLEGKRMNDEQLEGNQMNGEQLAGTCPSGKMWREAKKARQRNCGASWDVRRRHN